VTILGTSEDYAPMFNYRVAQGRFLTRDDIGANQKVAVLGHQVALDLFGKAEAVGHTIRLKGASFRVIGVMEKKGNIGFRTVDSQVMIPITTAMSRLLGRKFIDSIWAQAAETGLVEQAIDEIKGELRRRHDIRFRSGQEDDFRVFSQEEQRRQIGEIVFLFQVVLYSIALISLVVGGIGIMNIMLVSVTERTREIGVRMAVGARRGDILLQFLIEASTVSLLGGAFGVGCGFAFNNLIEEITQIIETYTPASALIWALSMAIGIGIISGIYPAYKASRLDPVEALRYE
jgi:putative ABC transport system permease protein